MIDKELTTKGEFYISPLYNLLIEAGLKINNIDVDKIHILEPQKSLYSTKTMLLKNW